MALDVYGEAALVPPLFCGSASQPLLGFLGLLALGVYGETALVPLLFCGNASQPVLGLLVLWLWAEFKEVSLANRSVLECWGSQIEGILRIKDL